MRPPPGGAVTPRALLLLMGSGSAQSVAPDAPPGSVCRDPLWDVWIRLRERALSLVARLAVGENQ